MKQLSVRLGNDTDLAWAQRTVKEYHYLRQQVNNQARPMAYIVDFNGDRTGLIMVGIPHATRNKNWYGYPGQITQWQVVDLCRIWIDPRFQINSETCGVLAGPTVTPGFYDRRGNWRSTLASWAIGEVLNRVQYDRVSLYPPVYLDQPYHILLAISYHDPSFHKGTIYKETGWEPMYWKWDKDQATKAPIPSKNGKFGWVWRLPEPTWTWDEITIRRPRTLRMF